MMDNDFKVYKDLFSRLTEAGTFTRLGRTFKTTKNFYFYDMGTGKIFQINEDLYTVLKILSKYNDFNMLFEAELSKSSLLEALKELKQAVENENILLAPPVKELTGPQDLRLEESLKNNRSQLSLELTEKCNLRCKYCIYQEGQGGFREFGKNDMTFEIAKHAIDQLMENSSNSDDIYVSFYGGEPLIKYDLIEKCIDYCEEKYENKSKAYAMTTNATLMTPQIAEKLASLYNVHITVSLDGPKEIHDKYRVHIDGKGSFEDTMNGLGYLVEAFGDRAAGSILFNVVISEYDRKTLDKIQSFFESLDWMSEETAITTSYVSNGEFETIYDGVDSEQENEIRRNNETLKDYFDPIGSWGKDHLLLGTDSHYNKKIAQGNLIKDLSLIHNRNLVNKPIGVYFMNGCCVPGARRAYVTTNGEYLICEKMGPSPGIGDVFNGLNIEDIRKYYVKDFQDEALNYCKNCWAIHLCSLCYVNCYNETGTHFLYRHGKCETNRILIENTLSTYHQILENSPDQLSFLNDYTFS